MSSMLEQVLERSRELARAGLHAEDLALLRDALDEYPGEPEVALRAAVAYYGEDDAEAQRLARRAATLGPEDPVVLTRAASVMLDLGRTDEALELTGRARDHADHDFPLLADLVHLAGRIALVRGEYEKAESPLRVAFENQPESFGHGQYLATLLESQGRAEEALEVVEESLRHWPDDPQLDVQRIRLRLTLFGPDSLPSDTTFTQSAD